MWIQSDNHCRVHEIIALCFRFIEIILVNVSLHILLKKGHIPANKAFRSMPVPLVSYVYVKGKR